MNVPILGKKFQTISASELENERVTPIRIKPDNRSKPSLKKVNPLTREEYGVKTDYECSIQEALEGYESISKIHYIEWKGKALYNPEWCSKYSPEKIVELTGKEVVLIDDEQVTETPAPSSSSLDLSKPLEDTFKNIVRDTKAKRKGENRYQGLCPSHDDRTASLTISLDSSKGIGLFCHAGCNFLSITSSLNISQKDCFSQDITNRTRKTKPHEICRYDYLDVNGELKYQISRMSNKSFIPIRKENGKEVWNFGNIERIPYKLPELAQAIQDKQIILFVEGEKDVDNCFKHGLTATTIPGGAGKWRPEYLQYFKGADIVLIPDNDKPGRDGHREIANHLKGKAKRLRYLELPKLPNKGDITNWFDKGGTKNHLLELIENAPDYFKDLSIGEAEKITFPEDESTSGSNVEKETEPKESQATILVKLAVGQASFFHDQHRDPYAKVKVKNHFEIWSLKSTAFKLWLSYLYYNHIGKPCGDLGISEALRVLGGKALFEDKQHHLYLRVAEIDNVIWYDLCDPEWKVIKITSDGWEVISDPPILFKRLPHMQSQKTPTKEGDIKEILEFVNLRSKGDELLFLIQTSSWFLEAQPKPLSLAYGEKGASKTTLGRVMKRVVDPSSVELLSLPKTDDGIIEQMSANYVLVYDNLSGINNTQSDILCRGITGGGSMKRKLYTDNEQVVYQFRKCIAINGINNVAHNSDLLDRSIINELKRIPKKQRKTEREFWSNFEKVKPCILSGIFNTLSKALKLYPTIKVEQLERLADFTVWGCAIAKALGYTQDEFLTAYRKNIDTVNEDFIEDNPLATTILDWWEDQMKAEGKNLEAEGYAKDFFDKFNLHAEKISIDIKDRYWPKSPNHLRRHLIKMLSNLEQAGLRVTFSRNKKGSRYVFRSISHHQ